MSIRVYGVLFGRVLQNGAAEAFVAQLGVAVAAASADVLCEQSGHSLSAEGDPRVRIPRE